MSIPNLDPDSYAGYDIKMETAVSIIIVTYKRLRLFKKCLESIKKSLLPEDNELIVIINGDDKETKDFLGIFKDKALNLRFYEIPKTNNGKARNEGIKYANGKILYFLDDDVIVDRNTFQGAINKFSQYPDISIIGGPNLTPPQSNLFQKSSGFIFSSLFGSCWVRYRYLMKGKDRLADDNSLILCNLAIRKDVFDKEKLFFDEGIASNEENLLLQKLKIKGYKMLYSPGLFVYHERRKSLLGFSSQLFKYGKGRSQQIVSFPQVSSLFYALPSLFVFYLISLIFFHRPVYFIPLLLYLILDLSFSFQLSLKYRIMVLFPLLLIMFPTFHIAYGTGLLSGLIIFPCRLYKICIKNQSA